MALIHLIASSRVRDQDTPRNAPGCCGPARRAAAWPTVWQCGLHLRRQAAHAMLSGCRWPESVPPARSDRRRRNAGGAESSASTTTSLGPAIQSMATWPKRASSPARRRCCPARRSYRPPAIRRCRRPAPPPPGSTDAIHLADAEFMTSGQQVAVIRPGGVGGMTTASSARRLPERDHWSSAASRDRQRPRPARRRPRAASADSATAVRGCQRCQHGIAVDQPQLERQDVLTHTPQRRQKLRCGGGVSLESWLRRCAVSRRQPDAPSFSV